MSILFFCTALVFCSIFWQIKNSSDQRRFCTAWPLHTMQLPNTLNHKAYKIRQVLITSVRYLMTGVANPSWDTSTSSQIETPVTSGGLRDFQGGFYVFRCQNSKLVCSHYFYHSVQYEVLLENYCNIWVSNIL